MDHSGNTLDKAKVFEDSKGGEGGRGEHHFPAQIKTASLFQISHWPKEKEGRRNSVSGSFPLLGEAGPAVAFTVFGECSACLIHHGQLPWEIGLREGRRRVKQLPGQVFKQSKHKDFLEKLHITKPLETLLIHVSKGWKTPYWFFQCSLKKKKKAHITDSCSFKRGFLSNPLWVWLLKAADSSKTSFTNGHNSSY